MVLKTTVRSVGKVVDNAVNKSIDPAIEQAAALIRGGEVVAFPTETVYGLGGDATNDAAIKRIFAAKGRPADNPLIVHVASVEEAADYTRDIPLLARELMDAFWPGPLTIILPHNGTLSPLVTAGLDTVGLRMPAHPVARQLIAATGRPLAAPSSNRSGRPSPTEAAHVLDDLNGRIPMILDGGSAGVGLESTVVEVIGQTVMVLRPGGVTLEELRQVSSDVVVDPALSIAKEAPRSPGMKYTHYAPEVPLFLVEGELDALKQAIEEAKLDGARTGALVVDEWLGLSGADQEVTLGKRVDLHAIGRELYRALREFKARDVDILFTCTFPDDHLGGAIMNRLTKASEGIQKSDA
ncbi:L-threonylcarbamoyladenylate synthase [Salisediminibacterium beveridgei]|uniref:Threonylcarbamoyl-AMP synthase n=1 Tax=Salisediminibacterium beveridgei TaxID=632773 RepID=A0A1D7QRC7_9BACI|nr:L-threonylcarbamoyladenylate synthase [Salisediminibacterium beveridgei]AOM81565.1 putative tRNA threonylcarbamoyladenosine biosynthesis protein YwlC [Salisediminibacterium beveridgei]